MKSHHALSATKPHRLLKHLTKHSAGIALVSVVSPTAQAYLPLSPALDRTLRAFILRATLRLLLFKGLHSLLILNSFKLKEAILIPLWPALQ